MKRTYKLTLYTDEEIGGKIELKISIETSCVNPNIFLQDRQELPVANTMDKLDANDVSNTKNQTK